MALVFATWKLAIRFGNIHIAALTSALVAVSPSMVQYSTEAKQYGIDPIVSVLLLILTLRVAEKPDSKQWLILLLSGMLALGFSMPAVFVLAGVWSGLLAVRSVRQKPAAAFWFLGTAVTWAVTFVACYLWFYSSTANNSYMRRFWMGTFLRDHSTPFAWISYIVLGLIEPLFTHAGTGLRSGNPLPVILALSATTIPLVVGLITLFRRCGLSAMAMFCVPVVSAAAASALGLWIFTARLMLYATPFLALLVALGLWHLCEGPAYWRAIVLLTAGLGFASLIQSASERAYAHRLVPAGRTVIASMGAGMAIAGALWLISTLSKFTRAKIIFVIASSGLLALPTIAVLWTAIHVNPDRPKTLIWSFVSKSRPSDSIYIASRALPAWIFYTTNWAKPDSASVTPLMEAATSIGPNSGNAASRGHEVRNEGGDLNFTYKDGLQLVGIATGVQNTALGEQVGKVPDLGWAANEASRISAAARPRIWVLLTHFPDIAARQLLEAIAVVHGKEVYREQAGDSKLILYEFPPASTQ
jgi:hypothetical protein